MKTVKDYLAEGEDCWVLKLITPDLDTPVSMIDLEVNSCLIHVKSDYSETYLLPWPAYESETAARGVVMKMFDDRLEYQLKLLTETRTALHNLMGKDKPVYMQNIDSINLTEFRESDLHLLWKILPATVFFDRIHDHISDVSIASTFSSVTFNLFDIDGTIKYLPNPPKEFSEMFSATLYYIYGASGYSASVVRDFMGAIAEGRELTVDDNLAVNMRRANEDC